jgi:hypothetical protein
MTPFSWSCFWLKEEGVEANLQEFQDFDEFED